VNDESELGQQQRLHLGQIGALFADDSVGLLAQRHVLLTQAGARHVLEYLKDIRDGLRLLFDLGCEVETRGRHALYGVLTH
jgi:hypothetical protein